MTAEEIQHRIALLFNPMPDMSGNNINRLHDGQRRQVEDLARDIIDSFTKDREAADTIAPDTVIIRRVGTRVILQARDLNAALEAEQAMKFWVMHDRFD